MKAIRFQTLDLVEVIYAWKSKQKAQTRQFFYRGENYLLKMMEDTAFLDNYDELGEHFGFYFTGNPLMYSGVPENEMPSLLHDNTVNQQSLFKPSAVDRNAVLIDGLSESRIRAAENIVFKEHAMVNDGGGGAAGGGGANPNINQQNSLAIGEGNMYESVVGDAFAGQGQGQSSFVGPNTTHDGHTAAGDEGSFSEGQNQQQRQRQGSSVGITNGQSNHSKTPSQTKGPKVTSLVNIKRYVPFIVCALCICLFFCAYILYIFQHHSHADYSLLLGNAIFHHCSQKRGRIKTLKGEIEELQAMRCHVTDQINSLVEEHGVFTTQHTSMERRRIDAVSLENMGLAKRLGVEISILEGELSHRASEVKNHQRQSYFLQQEIARRKGLIKVLMAELAAMESKAGMKKKLMKIQKKEGIYAALIKVNSVVDEHVASVESPQEVQDKEIAKEFGEDMHEEVEQEDPGEEEEPQLDAPQSVFSNMEMEGTNSSIAHGLDMEQSQEDYEVYEQEEQPEVELLPEERLVTLPVAHADHIIDDVNSLASSIANFAVSSTLEMVWFVMGAAEEVRPAKIATRSYVRDCLVEATTNIACSRATADATVLDCLLDGFQNATITRVRLDFINARKKVITDCVTSACTTGLEVAVNIITHEAVAKQDRAEQRLKVFSKELATSMVTDVFSSVFTAVVVKNELERLDALRIEEEKQQRVVEEVANVCDEFTFSSIGAALYTIENKVMRYKTAMDFAKKESSDPNSVGVMVHPAGAGFALAKMIKQQNRPVELEMYDIDAKTGVKHTFPSISRSHADPNVTDLINEALDNTGDDYGRVMYGKELGLIHQTEVEFEDWIFDARLVQDIDQTKLVAICAIPGLERSLAFVLSKEQEGDLENTRNPANFIRFILTSALQD